jgi:hypothetical protein
MTHIIVIPAKAGIQLTFLYAGGMDSRLRGNDVKEVV